MQIVQTGNIAAGLVQVVPVTINKIILESSGACMCAFI